MVATATATATATNITTNKKDCKIVAAIQSISYMKKQAIIINFQFRPGES